MMVKVHGTLTGVEKDQALVEINWITYGVLISKAVAAELITTGAVGKETTLHTISYIEGNPGMGNLTPRLVGFPNKTDLEFFSMLTTVQGLGVKKALRALAIPVSDVARAIELNDIATLKNMPEIGGKTAQKIIVELQGKVTRFALIDGEAASSQPSLSADAEYIRDAVDILLQLQYTESEAEHLVRQTIRQFPDITAAEDIIQLIFKQSAGPK